MNWTERLHEGYVFGRRVKRLSGHLAELIPQNATVLDVGCGDGRLAAQISKSRPDLAMKGLDVLIRPQSQIPVKAFDGCVIPEPDKSIDVVMLVDVLHHAQDPEALLREACRVARRALVIKDHLRDGFLATETLRFMDRVGNARHGVSLPYNYWPRSQWLHIFKTLGLHIADWRDRLGLYPWPASWVFERSLHFAARLDLPIPDPIPDQVRKTCLGTG